MTRKEPQFSDDLTTPISVSDQWQAEPLKSTIETPRTTPSVPRQSSSNWLLWLFVIVSLCVSFGMAFFGLEEAGRYQAALSQAESQAEELEATIQRLNQAQTQGIGELAQSDAQMRKMVQSVEARLKSDLGADLTVMAKQVKALQQALLDSGKTSDALEKQVKILQQRLSESEQRSTTLESKLSESEQRSTTLESKLDESVALLGEQVNAERTRIDGVAGTRQAVMALSEEVRATKEVLTRLDNQLNEVSAAQLDTEQTVKAVQFNIDGVNEQLTQLADTNNALLGLEVLSEEFSRLAEQVGKQQQILEAVDASRKQLTQRIIDLDGRVNLALSPKE
ncbi:MAG: hypothetical protein O3A68_04370 [Proteobacteria bacterium]|nr:hypothetical protein [Pseudomonadota bacterium]